MNKEGIVARECIPDDLSQNTFNSEFANVGQGRQDDPRPKPAAFSVRCPQDHWRHDPIVTE
jgi:hypothetical protein